MPRPEIGSLMTRTVEFVPVRILRWVAPVLYVLAVGGLQLGRGDQEQPRAGIVAEGPSQAVRPIRPYTVRDGKILDPDGRPFVVKGVVAVYGAFSGGDEAGFGEINYRNASRDFDEMKRRGINLVRVFIDFKNLDDYHKARLHDVVAWGRARGLIVYISVSGSGDEGRPDYPCALPMLRYLGSEYRRDPGVWIGTMNEPNCGGPSCSDWSKWWSDHRAFVAALRSTGYAGPIVVNTVYWSSDLSKIGQYPLADDNLIYGAHRYGNENAKFSDALRREYDLKWADLARTSRFAIILDEVGAWNGPQFVNSLEWASGFMDYVADWVNRRGGDGAIAFNWFWSDSNSLTGDWRRGISDNVLTRWGEIFFRQYVQKAPAQ